VRDGGGTVIDGIDGTASPAVYADVGFQGDRIVGVGTLPHARGLRATDATGKVVGPGFPDGSASLYPLSHSVH
jgi:cytosine/adenosine deaminase-related metal-dependent hydrolase